jgi:hypothetical protein
MIINRLRVANELGFLVHLPEGTFKTDDETLYLVMFSAEEPGTPNLDPPRSLDAARIRQGNNSLFGISKPFDHDTTAKGLGSKGANTPAALHPDINNDDVTVRHVAFSSLEEFYRRDVADAGHSSFYLLARHLGLLTGAVAVDTLTHSDRGTRAAMAHMEKDYGDKRLVIMDTPPSWQLANQRRGIEPVVPPKAVLVRGGPQFSGSTSPPLNRMTRIGGI